MVRRAPVLRIIGPYSRVPRKHRPMYKPSTPNPQVPLHCSTCYMLATLHIIALRNDLREAVVTMNEDWALVAARELVIASIALTGQSVH